MTLKEKSKHNTGVCSRHAQQYPIPINAYDGSTVTSIIGLLLYRDYRLSVITIPLIY
jgi:hypothetical protein